MSNQKLTLKKQRISESFPKVYPFNKDENGELPQSLILWRKRHKWPKKKIQATTYDEL